MKKMDGKFKISLLFLAVILIIPVIGPHLIRHDPYAVNVRNGILIAVQRIFVWNGQSGAVRVLPYSGGKQDIDLYSTSDCRNRISGGNTGWNSGRICRRGSG